MTPTTPTKVGELSANDQKLLSNANAALNRAQTVLRFVSDHLVSAYSLTQTQAIEANGDIVDLDVAEKESQPASPAVDPN